MGYANTRANIGAPERNLPAAAVSIIRAIMHSCLIWFSCHHSDCIGQLVQIVKCSVLPHNLPEFFWMHLQKDIKNLSSSIGRSIDESAVLIHLVLKRMLFENPPKGKCLCQNYFIYNYVGYFFQILLQTIVPGWIPKLPEKVGRKLIVLIM